MKTAQPSTEWPVLRKLAELFGTSLKNRRLNIPKKYGKGYCSGFVFNGHIRMLIMNYELHGALLIENPEHVRRRMILFKFQNVLPPLSPQAAKQRIKAMPSVLITTASMNAETIISVHSNTETVNIEVDADYLEGLLEASEKSPVLQSLLENTQPLLFEERLSPHLQTIIDEMVKEPVDPGFELFFLRVKAEELVCKLLMELEKREEKQVYALNSKDTQTLYTLRAQMLENLGRPPVIKDLAAKAGMSPTKLKVLFKQIFGNSIFSYYQEFRMKEAARLLKEGQRTVSEVGYQLGFTNLSHFSRAFEAQIGMKPKRYSRS